MRIVAPPQATTKQGVEQYEVVQPKYKKGGYLVWKVLVKATYGMNMLQIFKNYIQPCIQGYLEQLLQETVKQCNMIGHEQSDGEVQSLCALHLRNRTRQQQYSSTEVDLTFKYNCIFIGYNY